MPPTICTIVGAEHIITDESTEATGTVRIEAGRLDIRPLLLPNRGNSAV
jgi:hypothetical protein